MRSGLRPCHDAAMDRRARLRALWRADGFRYTGRTGARALVWAAWAHPGYRYLVVLRAQQVYTRDRGRLVRLAALLVLRVFQRHWGIDIPVETAIGDGFYIGHYGGIVVNGAACIGRNCNIHQGVTIGQANRGRRAGAPVIGDGVWIGPGARVVGGVTVGDNAVIGPNCVVTESVPANAVLAAPAPVVVSETRGAGGYVRNTV
jgi:serine O-acetyltransferase